MNPAPARRSLRSLFSAALLGLASFATLEAKEIEITFLPPPMQGSLSLGVYDGEGRLVRVLHSEAPFEAFVMALNGLITRWDGRDDGGQPLPPGRYRVRGYLVGDLKVEGVGFEGNDWVSDEDAPRLRRISRLAALPGRAVLLEGETPSGAGRFIAEPVVAEGETEWKLTAAPTETAFPQAVEAAPPQELPEAEEPYPVVALASAPDAGEEDGRLLYVLGANETGQQVRAVEVAGETLRPVFEKTIHFSDRLEQALPWLKFPDGTPFTPAAVLRVALRNNPLLERKERPTAKLRVEAREGGMFLLAADGLPLAQLSETPHLRWAALGRPEGGKEVVFFESDGAVVAEYRSAHLAEIMAFDAGTFRWNGEAEATPAPPEPTAEPSATPASLEPTATPEPTPEAIAEPTPEPVPTPQP